MSGLVRLVPTVTYPKTGARSVDAAPGARRSTHPAALAVEPVVAVTTGLVVGLASEPGWLVVATVLGWSLAAYHAGVGATGRLRSETAVLARGATITLAVVALLAGLGLVGSQPLSAPVAATVSATAAASLLRVLRRRRQVPQRVLLVGDRYAVTRLADQWAGDSDVEVVGVCLIDRDPERALDSSALLGVPVVTDLADIPAAVGAQVIDSVLVTPGPWMGSSELQRLAWSLEELPVSLGFVGVLDATAPHRVTPGRIGRNLVIEVSPSRRSAWLRAVKSLTDRALAMVLLVVAAPVIAAMVLVVRLDSQGPAIYRQVRIGRDGRPFTMYKMRSMDLDADVQRITLESGHGEEHVLFKIPLDPRMTRVGRLLRKSSLDELPQLVNVVKGEMSLIGPRPALPEEVAKYDQRVRRRLAVKPGLTGLWQVSGRSDLSWEESVALDVHYVDNWRLVDDLRIAIRTVDAVVLSRGAY